MTIRGSPAYTGYVVGFNPSPTNPSRMVWKVRVLTGPDHVGDKFEIRDDHVPRGRIRGKQATFDLDAVLMAVNVTVVEP
ncbi:MAG: hypothetical protein HYV13_02290 [Candidatus Doudnabacteria bacterium]|nr:hypothetical protein [Candidatus Doudnabacteria bacterium]